MHDGHKVRVHVKCEADAKKFFTVTTASQTMPTPPSFDPRW